mmetsp:Transcript_23921/g.36357  ORF Transcript_23921/g.36357 Transcript_23921/m.36357 type:complete len:158 (-) Transcript_23921:403-876(-)
MDVLYPNRSNEAEPRGANRRKFCPEGQVGLNGRHVSFPECTVDTINGKQIRERNLFEVAGIEDQTSVPILYDKETNTVVSNENTEIVRMLGTIMKEFQKTTSLVNLYPSDKSHEIDRLNNWIYQTIANGSDRAGFSSNQDVYKDAYKATFDALEKSG